MWENFLKSFIPLFVALDVLGVLPIYARFAIGFDEKKRGVILRESIVTAFLVTIGFIALGNQIMRYLNISIHDFLIAGGIILFILALRDLIGGGRVDLGGQQDLFAVVPLGVPLLAGPAVLATSLIIANTFGFFYALASLVINLLVAGLVFKFSVRIIRFISPRWIEAISKVFVLFLAAIAIMFVRTGLQGLGMAAK